MNFHVGQKVVWIPPRAGEKRYVKLCAVRMQAGVVYTIRDVDTRAVGLPGHDAVTLRFEGIRYPEELTTVGMWEHGYDARFFRPLVTRKTSIEIFQKLLKPTPQKVLA